MSTPTLMIVIASTRPGRVGLPVARWFEEVVRADGQFRVDVADLAEIDLPLLDEPHHPRQHRYTKEHTKRWSAQVDAADAIVFVMPEYNYGFSAPLKNAIDYLSSEWAYKPVSFVSYGGISGGLRAVQMLKEVVTTLKMMPLPEAVAIPSVHSHIEDGVFVPNDHMTRSAKAMLDELLRWTLALEPLRERVEAAA